MTALGINVSEREAPTTHTPVFRTRTPLEIAYREAQEDAEHKGRLFCKMVDTWAGDQEKIDAEWEIVEVAQAKAYRLYKQLHCDCENHPSVEVEDGVVCMECGRQRLSGKRIV